MAPKTKSLFVFIALIAFCIAINAQAKEIDLFVLAGQSNMLGYRGDASFYPADTEKLDDLIEFYWVAPGLSSSNGKWTHMQPQGGLFRKGHFGLEVSFARGLLQTGIRPYIFKYSVGSTSLAKNWLAPGQHGLYDDMVAELQKAIALQEQAGNKVKIRALIWVQGESDAETIEMAKEYRSRLSKLLRDFRERVSKNPRLPIVLGVDEQHPWVQANPVVVESQKQLVGAGVCQTFTSMVGLQKADVSHLAPVGLVAHGKLVLEAYLKLGRKCI